MRKLSGLNTAWPQNLNLFNFRDLFTGWLRITSVKAFAGGLLEPRVHPELDLNEEDGGSVWDEAGRQVPGGLASSPSGAT